MCIRVSSCCGKSVERGSQKIAIAGIILGGISIAQELLVKLTYVGLVSGILGAAIRHVNVCTIFWL